MHKNSTFFPFLIKTLFMQILYFCIFYYIFFVGCLPNPDGPRGPSFGAGLPVPGGPNGPSIFSLVGPRPCPTNPLFCIMENNGTGEWITPLCMKMIINSKWKGFLVWRMTYLLIPLGKGGHGGSSGHGGIWNGGRSGRRKLVGVNATVDATAASRRRWLCY